MSDPGSISARFWVKVIKGPRLGDCWLWTGAISDDGYGKFWTKTRDGQQVLRAHRFAYEESTGTVLSPDVVLLHGCDVPLCVRPTPDDRSHVSLGTVQENNLDRSGKLRHANAYSFRWRGQRKDKLAAQSRALRAALLDHGWDERIIRPLMTGQDPEAPTLF